MRCAAFLRGLNVGGHRVKNPQLVGSFEAIGLREVSAFLASGNLAFTCEEEDLIDLEQKIESRLLADLGYEVPAFVRTSKQLHELLSRETLAKEAERADAKIQIGFLRAENPEHVEAASRLTSPVDVMVVEGSELFWLPTQGVSGSQIGMTALVREFGFMTVRTRATVERLAKKHLSV